MQIGIVTRTYKIWVEEFIKACENLGIEYKLIDIDKNDWLGQLLGIEILLWRVHLNDIDGLLQARIKIPIMEKMGIICLPSSLMCDLYDNKILQCYYFKYYNVPTPNTFISYSKADADKYCSDVKYPLVAKTSGGASSTGVFLFKNKKDAEKYNKSIFTDSILLKIFRRLCRGVSLNNKLSLLYKDKIFRYVYYQEYIKSDGDIRITTMGNNIVSVFKRCNRKNDFRASGSGIWEMVDIDNLPIQACDIALEISKKLNFSIMAYDFIKKDNNWLILEISYSFLLNDVYTNTLFEKKNSSYYKIEPVPVGVLHIQSILKHMKNKQKSEII